MLRFSQWMGETDVLRGLFDQKIISVLNVFLDSPTEKLSLSQVSSLSKVNITTTLRILDKLINQEFIELTLIGKSKFYTLKQSERTVALSRLLKKEGQMAEFIEMIKEISRVRKVVLETRTTNAAKVLIVGSFLPVDKINQIIEEIKRKHNFKIQFIDISEKQYEDMEKIGLYNLNNKIIWERKE